MWWLVPVPHVQWLVPYICLYMDHPELDHEGHHLDHQVLVHLLNRQDLLMLNLLLQSKLHIQLTQHMLLLRLVLLLVLLLVVEVVADKLLVLCSWISFLGWVSIPINSLLPLPTRQLPLLQLNYYSSISICLYLATEGSKELDWHRILSGGWINTGIGVIIVRSFSCRFSLPSCWNIRSRNSRYKRTSTC